MSDTTAEQQLETLHNDIQTGIDSRNPALQTALATTQQQANLLSRMWDGVQTLLKGPKAKPEPEEEEEPHDEPDGDEGQAAMFEDLEKGLAEARKAMPHKCSKCGHEEAYAGPIPEDLKKGPTPEMIEVSDLLHRVDESAAGMKALPGTVAELTVAVNQIAGAFNGILGGLQAQNGAIENLLKGPVAASMTPVEIVPRVQNPSEAALAAIATGQRMGQRDAGQQVIEPLTKGEVMKAQQKGLVGYGQRPTDAKQIQEIRTALAKG